KTRGLNSSALSCDFYPCSSVSIRGWKILQMSKPILEIKNLHAGVEGKQILKGVDLTINAGEVHAVMGPNGSGKSTLAAVLAGREGYEVTEGEVLYWGRDLLEMDPDERAREGVFLAFQY